MTIPIQRFSHNRFHSQRIAFHHTEDNDLNLKRISSKSLDEFVKKDENSNNFSLISDLDYLVNEKVYVTKDFNELLSFELKDEKQELLNLNQKIIEINIKKEDLCSENDDSMSNNSIDAEIINNLHCDMIDFSEESQIFSTSENENLFDSKILGVIFNLQRLKNEFNKITKLSYNLLNLYKYVSKN